MKVADEETGQGEARLYPVSLKLEGRTCLVVGGGAIALRKAGDLLACGARVRVVSPEWPADFSALGRNDSLSRVTRRFVPGDLDGVFLAIAATDDPEVQEEVAREAGARSIPCNVVDVNRLCSFYVPATLRRGALSVSVATDGRFPILAVALRDWLAGRIGPQLGPALERLAEARLAVRRLHPGDQARRARLLKALLTPDVLASLLEDRLDEFEAHRLRWQASLLD
jgi:precorrin-2 dehydrogenase/sirohydrochlorin ferrochelatase